MGSGAVRGAVTARSPWARATRSQWRSCRTRGGLRGFLSVAPRTRRPAQIQGFFVKQQMEGPAAPPRPASGEARVSLLSPRALVHLWSSFYPKPLGRNVSIFRFLEGPVTACPPGPAWSLGGARGPGTGVPPPVPKPLSRGFGRTRTGPGIRGRQPRGGLLSGRVLSQVGHRGPGRAFLIVRASPGLVSPSPVPRSPSSACV